MSRRLHMQQSAIGQMLTASNGELGYLLGDSGYPLRPWMVVPLDERHRDEMTQEKLVFNNRQTKCRSILWSGALGCSSQGTGK